MQANNGFFGSIQGPFVAGEELLSKIQEQCQNEISYLSKIGVHYVNFFDLDLSGQYIPKIIVIINGIEFQIGKTGILELEDTNITSIYFLNDTDDRVYIDYQYKKVT